MINNMIRIHIRYVRIITSVLYFIEVKTKKASGLNIRRLFNAVVGMIAYSRGPLDWRLYSPGVIPVASLNFRIKLDSLL